MNVLFRRSQVAQIRRGRKVQFRRRSAKVECGQTVSAVAVDGRGGAQCTYCWGTGDDDEARISRGVNETCKQCGGSGKMPPQPFASLKIQSVRRQTMGEATDEDAVAEGYPDVYALWDDWATAFKFVHFGEAVEVVRFSVEEVTP